MDVIHYLHTTLPICLLLTLIKYVRTLDDNDEPEEILTIGHIYMSGTGAIVHWTGLAISSIDKCEYSKIVNGSTKINITSVYRPIDNQLKLTNLKPSTRYGIILVCYDTNGKIYKSSQANFNFQTSAESPGNISSTSTTSSSQQHTLPYTSWPTTASTAEVYRRRFTPERSPTELGLGVAFGLIGAGVFGVVGYYVIKEYRRRIRIRRFLQYRRHENETFPDLADPEDEPVDEGIGL